MWRILVLGLLQGLTEFLPVSSSGHLVVLRHWFGFTQTTGAMEVALHVGTLVAVVVGYRKDLVQWLFDLKLGDKSARRLLHRVILASVPAAVLGIAAGPWVSRFFVPRAVAVGWLLTTGLLWATPAAGEGTRRLDELTGREAFFIGVMQALALWPGLSRSGSTIFIGRNLGLEPADAARFSFYLAIPAVTGAAIITLPDLISQSQIPLTWLGGSTVLAALSGLYAIKWVTRALKHPRAWRCFGLYTLALAASTWFLGG